MPEKATVIDRGIETEKDTVTGNATVTGKATVIERGIVAEKATVTGRGVERQRKPVTGRATCIADRMGIRGRIALTLAECSTLSLRSPGARECNVGATS